MTRKIEDFMAWLGGGNQEILAQVPQERARFIQMASIFLTTSSVAAFSMFFALHDGLQVASAGAIIVSVFWGIIILNLDRFLVLSIGTTRDRWRLILAVLPRLLMALLTSFIIATPLVLRVFATDIKVQLRAMHGDTGIVAQLQALSEISKHNSTVTWARLILYAFFIIIGILPVVAKVIINLGPMSAYEKVALSRTEEILDKVNMERIAARRIAESESNMRISLADDMRKREEALGVRANEHVASEMTKVLDTALQEWATRVQAVLKGGHPAEGSESAAGMPEHKHVDPGFRLPDDANLL